MGLRFRKSINLGGGVKLNLSKSGVGYSVGTKGLRVTKTANGRLRTTTSIPGTGISHVSESGGASSSKRNITPKNTAPSAKTNAKPIKEMPERKAEPLPSGCILRSKIDGLKLGTLYLFSDKIVYEKNGKKATYPIKSVKRARRELTNLNIAYEGGIIGGVSYPMNSIKEIDEWVRTIEKLKKDKM